ncbi:hypothetical protein LTR84_002308 [Exophiala bonariae]|uniref:Uncharacterized protein n=1 Tax=Exophiala bonariae TaxID=1690606 RepID=A0AAV9NEM3_9EURO|nr:hypothetical protein LTR84_002308 [Exophiala bonariae]
MIRRTQEKDRSRTRSPLAEISHNIETLTLDVGGGISPWGAPSHKEKDWGSPSRVKADRAWLEEHGERNVDLQTIRESMSSTASSSDEASTAIYSPTRHDRPMYDHDENRSYHDYDEDYDRRRHMDTTERNLQIEIRSINDDYERRSRRPTHHRQRHDSQESFHSMHSSQSSGRRLKPATTTYTTYDYYETRDSAYGSLESRGSNGYEVAKTEPYMYSPQSHTLKLKAPSTTAHGVYHTGFGISTGGGAVDIVTRAPHYTYSHRRY